MLKEIFGPKRDKRKLRKEKHHNLYISKYCTDDQIKNNETGTVSDMHGRDNRYVLVTNPGGRRPLAVPKRTM
jgi:hypothetical protein